MLDTPGTLVSNEFIKLGRLTEMLKENKTVWLFYYTRSRTRYTLHGAVSN